jgi:hypothetical protein
MCAPYAICLTQLAKTRNKQPTYTYPILWTEPAFVHKRIFELPWAGMLPVHTKAAVGPQATEALP